MSKRVVTAAVGAGRTDGPPDAAATTGGDQAVTYGTAKAVTSPPQVSTEGIASPNSRTVVTHASNGPLKLRYTPRKMPVERLPTS